VDPLEPRIQELLQVWPTMPATVIAERIGWTRGLTVLKDRIRELRPVYLPADPASRTAYQAGEVAQCDLWFPAIEVPVGFGQTRTATRLPVLMMVTAMPLAGRPAASLAGGRGPVLWLVAAHRPARGGAAGAGLGRRGRRRPAPPADHRADRGHPWVPWGIGRQGGDLQPGRSGGQGPGGAGQRLSGDLVSARPQLQLPG
jgi:hypothetical protein